MTAITSQAQSVIIIIFYYFNQWKTVNKIASNWLLVYGVVGKPAVSFVVLGDGRDVRHLC